MRRKFTRALTEVRPDTIYFEESAAIHFNIPVREEDEDMGSTHLIPPKVIFTFFLTF